MDFLSDVGKRSTIAAIGVLLVLFVASVVVFTRIQPQADVGSSNPCEQTQSPSPPAPPPPPPPGPPPPVPPPPGPPPPQGTTVIGGFVMYDVRGLDGEPKYVLDGTVELRDSSKKLLKTTEITEVELPNGSFIPGTYTFIAYPVGAGTYYLRARDVQGRQSELTELIVEEPVYPTTDLNLVIPEQSGGAPGFKASPQFPSDLEPSPLFTSPPLLNSLLFQRAYAQTEKACGQISGVVLDEVTQQPIPDAKLNLLPPKILPATANTQKSRSPKGEFDFQKIRVKLGEDNTFTVTAKKEGYGDSSITVQINKDNQYQVKNAKLLLKKTTQGFTVSVKGKTWKFDSSKKLVETPSGGIADVDVKLDCKNGRSFNKKTDSLGKINVTPDEMTSNQCDYDVKAVLASSELDEKAPTYPYYFKERHVVITPGSRKDIVGTQPVVAGKIYKENAELPPSRLVCLTLKDPDEEYLKQVADGQKPVCSEPNLFFKVNSSDRDGTYFMKVPWGAVKKNKGEGHKATLSIEDCTDAFHEMLKNPFDILGEAGEDNRHDIKEIPLI